MLATVSFSFLHSLALRHSLFSFYCSATEKHPKNTSTAQQKNIQYIACVPNKEGKLLPRFIKYPWLTIELRKLLALSLVPTSSVDRNSISYKHPVGC